MSESQNRPAKRQHTVPQFYLRRFGAAEGRSLIWMCDRLTGDVIRTSIKNACVRNHAYTLPSGIYPEPLALEEAFCELEGLAASGLRDLAGGAPAFEQRLVIAQFLAAQLKRSALVLNNHAKFIRDVQNPDTAVKIIERRRSRLLKTASLEEYERYLTKIQSGEAKIELSPGQLAAEAQKRIQRYTEDIMQMNWHVEKTNSHQFVTSDNPVFVRRRGCPRDPFWVGIERGDLNAELYAPLCPQTFLVASWDRIRRPSKTTAARAHELNRLTIICSERFVFGHTISANTKQLISSTGGFQLKVFDIPAEEI